MPGGYISLQQARRRTIPAPTNPMDKSTIVSIYPKVINEVKHTIQPGHFHIDAGTYEKPALLVVGSSSWWKEIDDEQPLLEIPNSSIQVADSVVRDYCNGLLGCNMGDTMPGIFWVPGSFVLLDIIKNHKDRLDKAQQNQIRYFSALVKMADSLWARTNGNPLVISDDMRMAARSLSLNSKDWMRDFAQMQLVKCPACATMISQGIIICPNCKIILDKKRFADSGMSFAS